MNIFDLTKYQTLFPDKARVLVAPLYWGIGHATRCITIINQLLDKGYTPVIASDGEALRLLQQIFPKLDFFELPSYNVTYSKKALLFKSRLLLQFPYFYKTYRKEQKIIAELVKTQSIDIIISDNRFGAFSKDVLSIYLTHQLRVKSGFTTFITTNLHRKLIQNFDRIWVPDVLGSPNLSGLLSHRVPLHKPVDYIGILSSFTKEESEIQYDILILLSGPEPQRTLLENKLTDELRNSDKNICLVKGKIEKSIIKTQKGQITIYNYLLGRELERLINQSKLIVARSGYSTVMDLSVLQKKVFFIPTPGQSEQLYLAKHLKTQGIAPYCLQHDFTESLLQEIETYTGFKK